VKTIRDGTPAAEAGVQEGDIFIAVNGVNVCNAKQKEVTELIKASTQCLRLKLLPAEDFESDMSSASEEEEEEQDAKSLTKNADMYKSKVISIIN